MGDIEIYKDKILYLRFIYHLLPHSNPICVKIDDDSFENVQVSLIKKDILDTCQKELIDNLVNESKSYIHWRDRKENIPKIFADKVREMYPNDPFIIITKFYSVEFGWLNKHIKFSNLTHGFLPNNARISRFKHKSPVSYNFQSSDQYVLAIAMRHAIDVLNFRKQYFELQSSDLMSSFDQNLALYKNEYSVLSNDCIRNTVSCLIALSTFMLIFLTNIYEQLLIVNGNKSESKLDDFNNKSIIDKIIMLLGISNNSKYSDIYTMYCEDKNEKRNESRRLLLRRYRCFREFKEKVYGVRSDMVHTFPIYSEEILDEMNITQIGDYISSRLDYTLSTARFIWNEVRLNNTNIFINEKPKYLFDLSRTQLIKQANLQYLRAREVDRKLYSLYVERVTRSIE